MLTKRIYCIYNTLYIKYLFMHFIYCYYAKKHHFRVRSIEWKNVILWQLIFLHPKSAKSNPCNRTYSCPRDYTSLGSHVYTIEDTP